MTAFFLLHTSTPNIHTNFSILSPTGTGFIETLLKITLEEQFLISHKSVHHVNTQMCTTKQTLASNHDPFMNYTTPSVFRGRPTVLALYEKASITGPISWPGKPRRLV